MIEDFLDIAKLAQCWPKLKGIWFSHTPNVLTKQTDQSGDTLLQAL
jgi:hypothetical protein